MTNRKLVAGRPDEWDAFAERNAGFYEEWPKLKAAMDHFANAACEFETKADSVLYFLVHLCAEDLLEIQLLAANGHGFGATKLLRGLYERVVTARYLAAHPGEVQRYIDWEDVTDAKVARAVLEAFRGDLPAETVEAMKATVASGEPVKKQFLVTDCKACGTERPGHTWSKLDLVSMAKTVEGGPGKWIVQGYYEPLRHSHATLKAVLDRVKPTEREGAFVFDHGPQHTRSDQALMLAHSLFLNALDLAIDHFRLAPEALRVAVEAFPNAWPAK